MAVNHGLLIPALLCLVACHHDPYIAKNATVPRLDKTQIPSFTCSDFLTELEGLGIKELKVEGDKIQKSPLDKTSDEYVRASLAAAVYHAKSKNYTRALELLSPLSNRKVGDDTCRSSLKLYIGLLSDLSQFEKDLQAEKKQKLDLERKLKALSDIEKEISQRDSRDQGF
jgi:hypothetical protein